MANHKDRLKELLGKIAVTTNTITVEDDISHYTILELVNALRSNVKEINKILDNLDEEIKEEVQRLIDDGTLGRLINEELLGEIDSKVDSLDSKVDGLDSKVDGLDSKIDRLDSRVDELAETQTQTNAQLYDKIQEVASTGTTTEVLQSTTENYIQEKLDDGTIANFTIEDASVTRNKLAFPLLSHLSVSNKNFVIEVVDNTEIIVKFKPITLWLTDNNFKTIKAINIEESQFVIKLYGMLGWDLKSNTVNVYPYNYEVTNSNIYPLVFFDSQGIITGDLIDIFNNKQINHDIENLTNKINDAENMVAYAPIGSKIEIHYDVSSKKVYFYCTNLRVKTRNFDKYFTFNNIKELFAQQIELYNGTEFLAINDGDCLTFNDETGNLEMTGWLKEVSTHHFRLIYNLAPNNLHGYLISYWHSHSINSINQSIANLNTTITESTSSIPDYFTDYTNNKIKAINLDLEKIGGDGFAFNVVGDMHYQTNSKNTHSLIKYITPQINAKLTIALGDYINNDRDINNLRSEYLEILKDFGDIDMIGCLGNHDDNSIYNQMEYTFDNKAMYNYINRKFEDDVIFGGEFYYYRDDVKNKIRYICLDTQDTGNPKDSGDGTILQPRQYTRMVSQNQIDWFSDVALNVDNEWSVIVFAHHNLFSDGIVGSESDVVNGSTIWNKLVQFKNNGGTVICWMNGHVHFDNLIKKDGINIVTVLNNDMSVWSSAPTKTKGTTSELAFDVAVVDKDSRTVKLHRIGAGVDRHFSY